MSENNAPQEALDGAAPGAQQAAAPGTQQGAAQALQQAAATPAARPEPGGVEPGKKKLSMFLRVSIILLIGLTLASISLLFIGDFGGRFERVFSTFALFALFVVLTAIDTSRQRASEWYAPVALIANTYILGLLLIVIWMTPYDPFGLMFEIFWKSFLVIVVTRLVIVCCELLLRTGSDTDEAGNRFAFITSVLAVLSGILFTAPVGIEAFSLHVPDLYWKIATAVLILTALGLSVTLLLRWANSSEERARKRQAAADARAVATPAQLTGAPVAQQPGAPVRPNRPPSRSCSSQRSSSCSRPFRSRCRRAHRPRDSRTSCCCRGRRSPTAVRSPRGPTASPTSRCPAPRARRRSSAPGSAQPSSRSWQHDSIPRVPRHPGDVSYMGEGRGAVSAAVHAWSGANRAPPAARVGRTIRP